MFQLFCVCVCWFGDNSNPSMLFNIRCFVIVMCDGAGGLGEAVCSAVVNEHDFTVQRLAVSRVPRSGKPRELLKLFSIDCDAIVEAVKIIINDTSNKK